jgi:hypothetical protein
VLGVLPVGPPTVPELALGLPVALLALPVALPVGRLDRLAAALLPAGRRVGVAGSGAQRLRHPPLGHRTRPGPLSVQVSLPLTVGEPLASLDDGGPA